jgi:hypothetical protein
MVVCIPNDGTMPRPAPFVAPYPTWESQQDRKKARPRPTCKPKTLGKREERRDNALELRSRRRAKPPDSPRADTLTATEIWPARTTLKRPRPRAMADEGLVERASPSGACGLSPADVMSWRATRRWRRCQAFCPPLARHAAARRVCSATVVRSSTSPAAQLTASAAPALGRRSAHLRLGARLWSSRQFHTLRRAACGQPPCRIGSSVPSVREMAIAAFYIQQPLPLAVPALPSLLGLSSLRVVVVVVLLLLLGPVCFYSVPVRLVLHVLNSPSARRQQEHWDLEPWLLLTPDTVRPLGPTRPSSNLACLPTSTAPGSCNGLRDPLCLSGTSAVCFARRRSLEESDQREESPERYRSPRSRPPARLPLTSNPPL